MHETKEYGLTTKHAKIQNLKDMRKLNMRYIPIYLSVRAHYFKSIEHDFEFSLNLHLAIPEMDSATPS